MFFLVAFVFFLLGKISQIELRYAKITALEIDSEGNTLVAGSLHGLTDASPDSLYIDGQHIDLRYGQFAQYNIFVAKVSPSNDLLWISKGFVDTFTEINILPYETITIDLDIKIDKFDNVYTVISRSGPWNWRRGGRSRYIRWENEDYEDVNNLLIKLTPNGSVLWHKSWRANNHPARGRSHHYSNPYRGSLLSVNKKGDILITSEVKPNNSIKTIVDSDTIQIKHINGAEIDEHERDVAILLLRFDNDGNFLFHRSIINQFDDEIPDYFNIRRENVMINDKKEIFGIITIDGVARFNTGELIDGDNDRYFISYDSTGGNMIHQEPDHYNYRYFHGELSLDDNDNISLTGTHLRDGTSYIYQSKVNSRGELIDPNQDISIIASPAKLASNILSNAKGDFFFTLRYTPTLSTGGIIHLDKRYELEVSPSFRKSYVYYFAVKISNNQFQWSTLYDRHEYDSTNSANNWHDSFRRNIPSKLRSDNKGNIYFNDLYTLGAVIGGVPMPRVDRDESTAFIATMSDENFRFPSFGGKTFAETNNNCVFDGADYDLPSVLIKRNDGKIGLSDKSGNYSLSFAEEGNFTLSSQLIDNNSFISNYIYDNCGTSKQVTYRDGEITEPQNLNFGYKIRPCNYLTIDITNQRRRRCFMSSTTVEYRNKGFVDAQNVEIKVEYPDYIFPVSSSPTWTRQEGNSYFFDVNSLSAGSTGKIVFQDSVICGIEEIRGLTQCVKATISPANSCEEWTDNENNYEITGRCVGGGIARYTIKNLTNTSTDSIPYRLYANSQIFREGNILIPANGETELEVFTNGMTVRMEVFPQDHEPISAFVEGCQVVIAYKTKAEDPNPVVSVAPVEEFGIALPQNDGGERMETTCSEILDSYDPNDKQVVPFGLTEENLIEKTTELDYTIRFQNTGTIEAVNIVVLDTLSEYLDIESIRLGMVSHDYEFFIDGDEETRVLRFEFNNINLPDSNTNEPESHGFIKFKIKQMANNPIGTVINNRAAIYFDFNSPIITNTISNKVAILPLRNDNLDLGVFNCSNPDFQINANAGDDIETSNSTATLAAEETQAFGNWTLLSGFGELEDASKNNSRITGLLAFPTKLIWRVAVCGEAKQDTITVTSTNSNSAFTINFDEAVSTLSVPNGKVTYQWYKDGVLIEGQTAPTLNLSDLTDTNGVYTVVISDGETSITSDPITIDIVLSNDDFIQNNYIKVFPNPTSSILNIELKSALNASEITLVNALGMELQTKFIKNSDTITLDLENLSNGIYFVKITSQKGIFYKKVVLKK